MTADRKTFGEVFDAHTAAQRSIHPSSMRLLTTALT